LEAETALSSLSWKDFERELGRPFVLFASFSDRFCFLIKYSDSALILPEQ
jgi:hypothetical protein